MESSSVTVETGSAPSRPATSRHGAAAQPDTAATPRPWRIGTRGIAVRLFLSCWLVYGLHFATDIVREIYPAVALGDHFSFRLDEYANLHPDLFETPGRGWHIGNNPGVSMLAAIPYALARPIIDPIVAASQARREASGVAEPPAFETPRPNARVFYAEAWRRGLDVKLGLAAWVMHALFMAPASAAGVLLIFYLLRRVLASDRAALWLALLYAFGTPVFFRTGFLNHNLVLGHIAFAGFLALWNPGGRLRWSTDTRFLLGGLAGGTALLFDYSGVVFLLGLFAYGLIQQWLESGSGAAVRRGAWYVLGTLAPVGLLWFYQWRAFGNPFLPGQHWMPPVQWIEQGYQGYGPPQMELFLSLLFDIRFGLFAAAPLVLLALAAPFVDRGRERRLPRLEHATMLLLGLALVVFFSGSNYTRLQFNTGIRYLAPLFPFLFVPAVVVLARMRPAAVYLIALVAVAEAWALAMYRVVETPIGVLDPLIRTFAAGFTLPALTTFSRTTGQYGDYFAGGVSALPLFALAAAVLYLLWSPPFQRTP